jgi:hypothetical protein
VLGGGDSSQLQFQFDELLKGLERQVETQAHHPLKKFHLNDHHQTPSEIVVGPSSSSELDIDSGSPGALSQ